MLFCCSSSRRTHIMHYCCCCCCVVVGCTQYCTYTVSTTQVKFHTNRAIYSNLYSAIFIDYFTVIVLINNLAFLLEPKHTYIYRARQLIKIISVNYLGHASRILATKLLWIISINRFELQTINLSQYQLFWHLSSHIPYGLFLLVAFHKNSLTEAENLRHPNIKNHKLGMSGTFLCTLSTLNHGRAKVSTNTGLSLSV